MRDAIVPLGALLALGLALRLIIAYVLLPGSGFRVDLASFNGWAVELAQRGPWGLYDRPIFVDYTPGYLYVLWALGLVAQAFGGPGAAPGALLKLPAIAADLGLALAVFSLAAELGATRRGALVAAATVLFVPVTWFDSAVWAQVDAVGTLVLLVAVRELWQGRSERAAILTTVAAIIKPQFGILIPLAAIVIIRRHWVERPADGSRLGGGPVRIVTTTLAGIVTASLLCLPFGITIVGLLEQIVRTASGYPYVTVNAYNPWALASLDGAGLASAGTWIRDAPNPESAADPFLALFGIPAVVLGSALIGVMIVGLMALLWRRPDDRRGLLVALAVMAVAFFVLPTRVHERYLYPFFALGAILVALRPRWAAVYAVLATANVANLYGVLTLPFYDNPGLGPLLGAFGGLGARLGEWFRSAAGVTLAAAGHVGGFAAATLFLARPAPEETDRSLDAAVEGAPSGIGKVGDGLPRSRGAPEAARAGAAPAGAGEEARGPVAPSAAPGWPTDAPGAPAARFDRSGALAREGGGRFDRLDLWLVVVLVVAALFLRTFRLGEPLRMHFDEVYHARTALEFLQDWTYGEPHAIYEWTHPHLAKYAMASSVALVGGPRVVATSALGTAVRDAAIEPRWDDPGGAGADGMTRGGERLYVATGDALEVYDLRTRERLARFALPGAEAVAVDEAAHAAYVGTAGGQVLVLDTAVPADALRAATGPALEALAPTPLADPGGAASPVERLWAPGDGSVILAGLGGDALVTIDAATGTQLSRTTVPGRADVATAGTVPALVAAPAEVTDVPAATAELARLLGGNEAAYRARLGLAVPEVVVTADLGAARDALDQAIADGRLPGLRVQEVPRVAVAAAAGVVFLEPATGLLTGLVALDAPATSLVDVEGLDQPELYAATGSSLAVIKIPAAGTAASLDQAVWMPGPVERVAYDDATQLLHVLGRAPDGGASTVYAVEPRGNSVYADAPLAFTPVAWASDTDTAHPATDRQQLLVFGANGASAALEIGQDAFAWRLPGVVGGALMAGLLFLLARILFRRRSIAVLAGIFALADGMLFVQSRIAMNDAYVAFFILAAATLFAAIWTGAWRWRGAFWVGLPIVGLLLGLALASKWVALYAIGGIGLLVLLRSALGRALIVVGLAGIAATLGYMAIATGPDSTGDGNVAFLLLTIALALLAAAIAALHPVAWSVEEVRIAVAGPAAAGILVGLAAIPLGLGAPAIGLAVALMAAGGAAAGAFWLAGHVGMGPLAPLPAPDDPAARLEPAAPAPDGWLRPGWLGGFPIAWAALSLVAIPLVVYVVSYLPWAALGNQIVPGWPPGNTGQTLADLTRQMYDYHNNLRATHAASSPWWAWPADLKPVWLYQESFAGPTTGAIYSGGNLVVWWLSIPAFAFAAWQAFRRRSLALGFTVILFLALWLPWARIDRATFEYHYYAGLPFVVLVLAYFVAEVWHGPSRRTWRLARGAAAGALLAPVALWLLRGPLCAFVDVEKANPGSQACSGAASLSVSLSTQVAGLLAVLLLGGGLLAWQLVALDRATRTAAGRAEAGPRLLRIAAIAAGGLLALAGAWVALPADPLVVVPNVPGELLAAGLLLVLGPLAWLVWTAVSPRRFVVGIVLAAVFAFVLFYPNFSGLPLPTGLHNWYQGLLPTWLYPFQFPVNTDPPFTVSFASPWPVILFVAVVLAAGLVAYAAWLWRLAAVERAAAEGEATAAEGEAAAGT